MEINKNSTDAKHVKMAIKLTLAEWTTILDKAASKVSGGMKIAGFRDGKASSSLFR